MSKERKPLYIPRDSVVGCLQALYRQNAERLKVEKLQYALALRQEARNAAMLDTVMPYIQRQLYGKPVHIPVCPTRRPR